MTNNERITLINKIENNVCSLADYLYGEGDKIVNNCFIEIERQLSSLRESFYDDKTYIKFVDRESGEVIYKKFEKGDSESLCRAAAKYYVFADLDDTFVIDEIVCDGRQIEYAGWQQGMLCEFYEVGSGEIIYSNTFSEWDH